MFLRANGQCRVRVTIALAIVTTWDLRTAFVYRLAKSRKNGGMNVSKSWRGWIVHAPVWKDDIVAGELSMSGEAW
jgi:hypothetical protein